MPKLKINESANYTQNDNEGLDEILSSRNESNILSIPTTALYKKTFSNGNELVN